MNGLSETASRNGRVAMSSKSNRRDQLMATIQKQMEAGQITQAQAAEQMLIVDEAYDDHRRKRDNVG